MALADSDMAFPVQQTTAPEGAADRVADGGTALPALARLPALHDEALHTFRMAQFLARSPHAALMLMVLGALVVAAGWASLRTGFVWSLLLLAGIVGMTWNFIRGFARSLRRMPLQDAAADLRALLMFCGLAWGSGAFLVLPPAPSVPLAAIFALVPGLMLSLLLKDNRGAAAFIAPAALTTAAAAFTQPWPHPMLTSLVVLGLGAAIAVFPMLTRRGGARKLPA